MAENTCPIPLTAGANLNRRRFIWLAVEGAFGWSMLLAGCVSSPNGPFLGNNISETHFEQVFRRALKRNKVIMGRTENVVILAYQGTLAAQERYIKRTDIGSAFRADLKISKPNVIVMPGFNVMCQRLALLCQCLGMGPAVLDMTYSSLCRSIRAAGDPALRLALESVLASLMTEKEESARLMAFFACVYTASVFRDVALSINVTPSEAQTAANQLIRQIESYRASDINKYRAIKSVLRIYYQTTLQLPITPTFGEDTGWPSE